MSVGGRSRGKRRVFPARHDWRRAINLARFGRKQKKRALFISRTSCRRVAGKSSELALGTAAGENTVLLLVEKCYFWHRFVVGFMI